MKWNSWERITGKHRWMRFPEQSKTLFLGKSISTSKEFADAAQKLVPSIGSLYFH